VSKGYWRTALGAFFTWLVPLVVSFGLYDPVTQVYLPNYIGFKLMMAALAAMTCHLTMRWISMSQSLTTFDPVGYVVLNSVLDLIVLVAVFTMPLLTWATTIFPAYVLIFGAVYLNAKRNSPH
jgi:predicted ABC-type exoprotein transport system permease subunit